MKLVEHSISFSEQVLINLIKHEYSCKILYVLKITIIDL